MVGLRIFHKNEKLSAHRHRFVS